MRAFKLQPDVWSRTYGLLFEGKQMCELCPGSVTWYLSELAGTTIPEPVRKFNNIVRERHCQR